MYWFPNRPFLQPRDFLARMDSTEPHPNLPAGNWLAEPKLNGDRLVLLREASGRWHFFNRHKKELKYRQPVEMLAALDALHPWKGDCQLDGELLHNHTKGVKNLVVLYDVYVLNGEPVRAPLSERQRWLDGLGNGRIPVWFHGITAPVCLSTRVHGDYSRHFSELTRLEEVEGLVFKRLDGMLSFNPNSSPDMTWQIKVRREAKNYRF